MQSTYDFVFPQYEIYIRRVSMASLQKRKRLPIDAGVDALVRATLARPKTGAYRNWDAVHKLLSELGFESDAQEAMITSSRRRVIQCKKRAEHSHDAHMDVGQRPGFACSLQTHAAAAPKDGAALTPAAFRPRTHKVGDRLLVELDRHEDPQPAEITNVDDKGKVSLAFLVDKTEMDYEQQDQADLKETIFHASGGPQDAQVRQEHARLDANV